MLATKPGRRSLRAAALIEPSTYLTDGARLFRVLRGFTHPAEESFALLEDCRSLKVIPFTPDELAGMGLVTVTPSPAR